MKMDNIPAIVPNPNKKVKINARTNVGKVLKILKKNLKNPLTNAFLMMLLDESKASGTATRAPASDPNKDI